MRILELFSGIGGVAESVRQSPELGQIHQAVDIDQECGRVYCHNFGSHPVVTTIESPRSWRDNIDWQGVDTWWLSPPCQPYCRRGRQTAEDPRRAALQQVMRVLRSAGANRPQRIALENVPEFSQSDDHHDLCQWLVECGYQFTEQYLCPTVWGIPNRRRRYYLTAWRNLPTEGPPPGAEPPKSIDALTPLAAWLVDDPVESLWIEAGSLDTVARALDIVDRADPKACTACFTGGYGKSIKQAGSYLREDGRLRRFSPSEIQRLLGFSESFEWPEHVSQRRQWKMLGNSLSIPVVRSVLETFSASPNDV